MFKSNQVISQDEAINEYYCGRWLLTHFPVRETTKNIYVVCPVLNALRTFMKFSGQLFLRYVDQ